MLQSIARGGTPPNLARKFGVSQKLLQRSVERLSALGAPIAFNSRRGYYLTRRVDLLNTKNIRSIIESSEHAHLLGELEAEWVVDSTNDIALSWLQQNKPNGSVCMAEAQHKGRGRSGHRWVSPLASSCCFSMIWRYPKNCAHLAGLSLASGVAIVRALVAHQCSDIKLKWPNDIFWHQRKIGGVLVELNYSPDGSVDVVLGVGINYDLPTDASSAIDQPVADLRSVLEERQDATLPTRDAIMASLLLQLALMLAEYGQHGFAPWRDAWQQLNAFLGKEVVVRIADNATHGIDDGVDEFGGLRLRTQAGIQLCYGGIVEVDL